MMPLKDKPKAEEEKSNTISAALSTEEIVSLLSKSNKDFIKESDISSNITNLFKKVTPSGLAEKSKDNNLEKKELSKKKSDPIKEKSEKNEVEEIIEETKPELLKKYTEEEAKKMANQFAKQYYDNGYRLGVKKTTEELQKGDKALAVILKNTSDNIFKVTPDFVKELNKSITALISDLFEEVLGYEIDNKNKFFQDRISKLADSVESSVKDIQIYLNPEDYSAINEYNSKNGLNLSFKVNPDEKLNRGDLRIKSGSIEMSDIVSNKVKFSVPNEIDIELNKIKSDSSNKKLTNQI